MPVPVYPGQLAERVLTRMLKLGLSTRELSQRTSVVYEYIRQIVRGVAYPTGASLDRLADGLGISRDKLRELAMRDRLNKKMGLSAAGTRGRDPSLLTIKQVWNSLTKRQQEDLTEFARYLARRNRGRARMPR